MTVVRLDDFRPGNGPCRRERIFAKIMERVVQHAPCEVDGKMQACGCWEWTGPSSGAPKPKNGARGHSYPRFKLDGGTMAVHKVMWELVNGPIPPRKQLDHVLCWTRMCVNPAHLEMVTHKLNQKRRDLRRRLLGSVAA